MLGLRTSHTGMLKCFFLASCIATTMAGCGGGGGAASALNSTAQTTPTTPAKQDKYLLQYSFDNGKSSLTTGGDSVAISVTLLDNTGIPVAGKTLSAGLSTPAQTGITLNKSASTTDNNGQIKFTLNLGNGLNQYRLNGNESLSIGFDDGVYAPVSTVIPIQITGTTFALTPQTTTTTASTTTPVTATIKDGKGFPISGLTVELLNGTNKLTQVTTTDGKAIFSTTSPSSGTLTLSAKAYATALPTKTQSADNTANITSINPSVASIFFDPANKTDSKINTDITLNFTSTAPLTASNIETTKGTVSISGAAITANSKIPGPATITITNPVTSEKVSTVINYYAFNPNPDAITIQSEQTTLTPNSSSKLTAKVVDSNGSVVKNATVQFAISSDPSGGNISAATAVSGADGLASIIYTAGSQTTQQNAVVIAITGVKAEGSASFLPVVNTSTNLTIGGQAVDISIATDNLIKSSSNYDKVSNPAVMYYKDFSLVVKDVSGNPIKNQTVTIQMQPYSYSKGIYVKYADSTQWSQAVANSCYNKPYQYPALLYTVANSGNTLVVTTNSYGRFDFEVGYPKNYATWFEVNMVATTFVNGTLGKNTMLFSAPGLADDMNNLKASPPFAISPYGTSGTDCTIGL